MPQRNASPTSSFDRPLQNHAMPTPMIALVWADGDLAAGKDKRDSNAMMMSASGTAEAKATMWSLEGRPMGRRVLGCDWRRCVRWGVWRCGDVWRCGGEEIRSVLSLA